MFLGCHLSCADGYLAMGKTALGLGADTFQFFTRNPRGGAVKPMDRKDLADLIDLMAQNGFGPVVAHAPYTLNTATLTEKTRNFARLVLMDDLERLQHFPAALYNIHPGCHVGQGAVAGMDLTAELLNEAMSKHPNTTVLLETMAGKGTELGRDFGELAAIIAKIRHQDKIGVCLDSCHVHDGGYAVKNDLEGVLKTFDRELGLDRLKAVHVNDSKNDASSRKDRHDKLGEGTIGYDSIAKLVWHPKLQRLPFILETPNDLAGYKIEIETLRAMNPKAPLPKAAKPQTPRAPMPKDATQTPKAPLPKGATQTPRATKPKQTRGPSKA